jgi:hypothetical protein
MRQLLRELAACGLLLAAPADLASAQQGSVQVTAATHTVSGDPARTGGQPGFEPDLGVTWLRPGTRFGTFQMEIRGTARDSRPRLGKAFVALRDWKHRGVTWTIEAGDTWFSPSIADYRLTNLSSPSSTFAGASVRARTPKASASLMVGRATAYRNIFGTDAEVLNQSLAIARGAYTASDRLEISARASHVRTHDLQEFTFTIARSDQGGGGLRFVLTPAVHLVADGTLVSFRRRGSEVLELDASALAGASILLARGWVQVNASRFSPGELPVLSQPLADRQTVFAAGEYDVFRRIRLLGGWEVFRSNLDPQGAADSGLPIPRNDGSRGFAGVRVPLGVRSSIGVRYEDGDRRSRYVGASPMRVSDTGVLSSEWQSTFGPINAFLRYARRENVETDNATGTYTQHDGSALTFVNVARTVQFFGSATATRNLLRAGGGYNFWQFGGGGQAQLRGRGLWLRAEGLTSRNLNILSDRTVPHDRFSLGLNGEIAKHTIIGLNVYADRYSTAAPDADPWMLRSAVRLSRNFATGGSETNATPGRLSRHGGTGSVVGMVFADWNANGLQDPGDEPLENIPMRLANLGSANTVRSGEFAFVNVPVGLQQVGIDMTSLPVDYDPPTVPQVQLELGRGESKTLVFGLVPLGTVSGRVIHDVNANGTADAGEPSLGGAVLTLDAGARSEAVRRGIFRFDAVRSGDHTLELLQESLPEGAAIVGSPSTRVTIGRDALRAEHVFLVGIHQRSEIRRVFPSGGLPGRPPAGTAREKSRAVPTPRAAAPSTGRAATAASPSSSGELERFSVQIAALTDPVRARLMVERLRGQGFPSYLVEPDASNPDGPYKVRIGGYPSRSAAQKVAEAIEKATGDKVWVIKER